MKSTKMLLIATAAMGGLLAGSAAHASVATSTSREGQSSIKKVVATTAQAGIAARMLADKHDCKGMNDCKGQGGCKSGENGCKGKNSCKGKGGCKTVAL